MRAVGSSSRAGQGFVSACAGVGPPPAGPVQPTSARKGATRTSFSSDPGSWERGPEEQAKGPHVDCPTHWIPLDRDTWKARVERDLKGADYERRLVTRLVEGIRVEPLNEQGTPTAHGPAGVRVLPPAAGGRPTGSPAVGISARGWPTPIRGGCRPSPERRRRKARLRSAWTLTRPACGARRRARRHRRGGAGDAGRRRGGPGRPCPRRRGAAGPLHRRAGRRGRLRPLAAVLQSWRAAPEAPLDEMVPVRGASGAFAHLDTTPIRDAGGTAVQGDRVDALDRRGLAAGAHGCGRRRPSQRPAPGRLSVGPGSSSRSRPRRAAAVGAGGEASGAARAARARLPASSGTFRETLGTCSGDHRRRCGGARQRRGHGARLR